MLLINSCVFLGGMILMIVLINLYKTLNLQPNFKPICDFKFSKVKYKKSTDKVYAFFDISVREQHTFFVDFPVLFKFYSDTRFKSKVRINYKSKPKGKIEEIINKRIVFETRTEECIHYINDIIVGQIFFEIEMDTEYGTPIIEFHILENKLCKLGKEYKIEIKFPEK